MKIILAAVFVLLLFSGTVAAENVAKIDTAEYATVQKAVDAACEGQTIVMLADSKEATVLIWKKVTLDLAGYVLENNGTSVSVDAKQSKSVIYVNATGNLTMMDSSPNRKHWFEYTTVNSAWTLNPDGNPISGENVYNSLADFNRTKADAFLNANTGNKIYINVTGGIITGGNDTNMYGGGVYVASGGMFTMTGGNIAGNSARVSGGGVSVEERGKFNMSGTSSVVGNSAKEYGGGVYVTSGGTFTMFAGSITGNSANENGGGLYFTSGAVFEISGTPKIMGNTKETGESVAANNVYTYNNHQITITGALQNGADIGISDKRRADFAQGSTVTGYHVSEVDAQYFKSDDNVGIPHVNAADTPSEGKLWMTTALNENTGKYYVTINAAADAASSGDTIVMISNSEETTITVSSKEITLDLAGFVLMRAYSGPVIAINSGGNLTVKDSKPETRHTFNTASTPWKWDEASGDNIISGGVITGGFNKDGVGSGVTVTSGGTFTMSGGNIIGNSGQTGGGVTVNSGGIFTMSGGNIIGNSGQTGGGVYVMSGGAFNVSGTPVIKDNTNNSAANNVHLESGMLITITGALKSGAVINITNPLDSGENFAQGGAGYTVSANDALYFHPDGYNNKRKAVVTDTNAPDKLGWMEIMPVAKIERTAAAYFTVQAAINDATAGDTITMTADSEETAISVSSKVITLNLAGFVLKTENSGPVIKVISGGNLTVTDSLPASVHYFSKDVMTGLYKYEGTSQTGDFIEINGGIITGGSAEAGAGVYVDGSEFMLSGGNIIGNNAATSNAGGVLVTNGSKFEMNGGSVVGNRADGAGGGVYINNSTFLMSGGNITENSGQTGGGVFIDTGGLFNISGSPFIKNNTAGAAASNVYLSGNNMLNLVGALTGGEVRIANAGSIPAKDAKFGETTLAAGNGENYFAADSAANLIGSIAGTNLVWFDTTPKPSSKSSNSDSPHGHSTSVWLSAPTESKAAATPTPPETAAISVPTESVPAAVQAVPIEPPASPLACGGIIAGLAAAVVLFGLRRK